MRRIAWTLMLLCLPCLAGCSGAATSQPAEVLLVQYTHGTRPWLEAIEECAGETIIFPELRAVDFIDLEQADLALRLGDLGLESPAYQVGSEDLLVVVHPENPVASLSASQVNELFAGTIANWAELGGKDAPVQAWVYGAEEDTEQYFEQVFLGSRPVTSLALLAPGPEWMLQQVGGDPQAIGLLTRSWLNEAVRVVYTVATLPVLVMPGEAAPEAATGLIPCLQK